ncbi:MAG: DMT family transporter [Bacteroidales bacterium]|nr:DMT family transporter [Bacteroidales bacterium]
MSNKFNNVNMIGHLCIAGACIIWGLMAPLGKDAMNQGISGIDMVTFRVVGGMICFWLYGWITRENEKVAWRDKLLFAGAGLLGIVTNQCCFTIGLSLTSPANASIMTTTMPVFTLLLTTLVLRERLTWHKILGVALGISGALILIAGSSQATESRAGNYVGDLMVIGAQCSFALYLTLFKKLIARYRVITCMKWMMLWAVVLICPWSWHEVVQLNWAQISASAWYESAFVVFFGTFVAYILMMNAQKTLRPTVVAMYNYVQPIVACLVSVAAGLATFGMPQAAAVLMIFTGVYLVTQRRIGAKI